MVAPSLPGCSHSLRFSNQPGCRHRAQESSAQHPRAGSEPLLSQPLSIPSGLRMGVTAAHRDARPPTRCRQLLAWEKQAGLPRGRLTPPAPAAEGPALTFHRGTFVRVGVTFSLPLDPPDYPSVLKQVLAFEVKQLNLKKIK